MPPLQVPEREIALAFFLTHFSVVGIDRLSTRGLFEIMMPIVSLEHHNSALSLSLVALSEALLGLSRQGPRGFKWYNQALSQTINRLKTAVQDPVESKSEATLLAVLILQFYENISALYTLRKTSRVHHNGAVALLKHQGLDATSTMYSGHLIGYILNSEVSSAIHENRRLPENIFSWMNYDNMLLNPCTRLDTIGINVANLQYRFDNLPTAKDSPSPSQQDLQDIHAETVAINKQVLDWLRAVPDDWQPARHEPVPLCSPPIITYEGTCEIYPSIQIASMWNRWRCYRLILLKISLSCLSCGQRPTLGTTASHESHYDEEMHNASFARETIKDIVDSICYSVPYYVGNRTGRDNHSDLTNYSFVLPGYHSLDSSNDECPDNRKNGKFMSKEKHNWHVIIQGPWHILSPLSHVLSFCSGDYGSVVVDSLGPGQLEWIRGQFSRVAVMMSLDPKDYLGRANTGQEADPSGAGSVESPGLELPEEGDRGAGFREVLYVMHHK
jgi:hypothetical protein